MSTILVNTLTGTSTAGSIAVTGEGNSTTTNLQQGLAKAWHNFDGTGTVSTRDNFNISSLTDNGTGDYTSAFSNSFGNINYVFGGGTMETGSGGTNESTIGAHRNTSYSTTVTTSSFTMQVTTSSGSLADRTVFISYTGDLA